MGIVLHYDPGSSAPYVRKKQAFENMPAPSYGISERDHDTHTPLGFVMICIYYSLYYIVYSI